MVRWQNKAVAAGAAVVLAAALVACSSSGGKQEEQKSGGAAGNVANTPRIKVALITHSGPGDTFWDIVRRGAEAAAQKDNVELQYSADPDGAAQANLVQTAIDSKVDGIAVTLNKPDAVMPNVKKAVAAGIPVTVLNGGLDVWQGSGALGYFGQDERIAGEAAGTRLKQEGAKKVICIIHEQGNVSLESRCQGIKDKFGAAVENLNVNGTDIPGTQATVTSKLQQDKTADYVVGLNAGITLAAVQAAKDAGSSAKIASFDMSKEMVKAIQDGTVQWTVDQQPYLQGYLAVDSIWLYRTNGDTIGGGQATLTGPAFIDKDNVTAVEKYAAAGTR
ncbi:monosaccharide ABC transporter substrate-binding protein (CUT2 family) [Kribbella amoyensis]|uniref:Monosaccharide ABC transporter substrate-binding protein (CUT2 family) n=1 Tax=Kribbella amoyensis TaxID=996641 RepID=A0A561BTT2_9ACTN|nr:sugar ABC transporter substrate-binding protein [Kribbella amoyensis]TWD82243.1 monosaccharide ABC transporter substrate-binding protein (CUT2 family) [Kribbella amoyensis]